MKIAVMSDSHRKTNLTSDAIELLKSKGAKYIIHAGDLEIEENLQLLENSGLLYTSVFGNNDYNLFNLQTKYNINEEPYYFKIKKEKFKLMHIPSHLNADCPIIIYGHTHEFKHQYTNNTLYLNPGEICARNKPLSECVLLEIKDDKYIIDYYFKEVLQDNTWKNKQFIYTK